MIYPFSGLLYLTLEFCACERRLNNTRRHLHVSRRYTNPLRLVYTRFASALCPLYAGLTCSARSLYNNYYSHFEFARHFESHLARPPPFYMLMRTTISDEHSIVTMLLSTLIIFSNYSLMRNAQTLGRPHKGKGLHVVKYSLYKSD